MTKVQHGFASAEPWAASWGDLGKVKQTHKMQFSYYDYHYKEEEEHMLKKQDDGDVDNDNQNEYTNTEWSQWLSYHGIHQKKKVFSKRYRGFRKQPPWSI